MTSASGPHTPGPSQASASNELPHTPTWVDGLSGVVSAAVGCAGGQLVALAVDPTAAPVAAVGAVVVDLVPGWLKDWAITAFGTADKAVLLLGVVAAVVVAAWCAGVAGRRGWGHAAAGLAVLGGAGVGAVAWRSTVEPLSFVPAGCAVVMCGLCHAAVYRLARPWEQVPEPSGGETVAAQVVPVRPGAAVVDRRTFAMGGAAALLTSGAVLVVTSRTTGPPSPVSLPVPAQRLPQLPAGVDVPEVSPLRTPQQDFFRIDIALVPPRIDTATWRLTVDGMVEAPFSWTWEELLAQPMVERDITLTCVSNEVGGELCGSGRWWGVPVAPLLRRARPLADADQVLSRAADGFTASTPLETLWDGRDALIAVALNGEPLSRVHGAPARLLVPGVYGYVGATKWLTGLTVSTFAKEAAYWTTRGWSDRGPVKMSSRIDAPRQGAVVS
ncbi:molybdopterin-dependent oxidoreductase, partial [Austwickia sp. TVS 96-490-7B]|uniref:molybdopterin-dependent oxidoreductase n=1 Tax=Austwickia sp. TVS 96-490-7B TaxID=2830843 RepID=UPI001C58771E